MQVLLWRGLSRPGNFLFWNFFPTPPSLQRKTALWKGKSLVLKILILLWSTASLQELPDEDASPFLERLLHRSGDSEVFSSLELLNVNQAFLIQKYFPNVRLTVQLKLSRCLYFFQFPRWQSTSCSKVNFSILQNNSKQLLRNLIFTSFKRFSKQPLYSVQCKPTTEILENLFWDDEGRTWHCFGSTHKNC